MSNLELRGVLHDDDPRVWWQEHRERIQDRGLARAGPTADQDVGAGGDRLT